ncbi:Casein kinase I isoform alpha [Hypsibius exemplaris]|uniref:Casein kinase I isoform alpha n=1 Tax=Hypsibius exemplaris TaxID=2072580 RepID=A0A1W0WFS3_HYPEX|nr:Casein kinase I isoform alpha [Hypsibius exemplaris]
MNMSLSKLNGNVEAINTESGGSNFRASLFAGSVGANVANLQAAKHFEREMNRKSYRQARADGFEHFDEQPTDQHAFMDTYSVSRGELLVAEKWRCVRKIAFGSTSVVYLAFSVDYEEEAAVKVCNFSKGDEALGNEANVYYYIQGGPGIPSLYWYGQEHGRHFLVTELLGPNLMDFLHFCDGKFTLKTVCMLAVQIFESLDWLHRSGYIHRDIRPQNFCMGNVSTSKQVFLIDYATAIKPRGKVTVQGQKYIPRGVGTRLKGHAIYDSVAAHYGNEHGFRDDVESSLYMLAHFLIGDLPWRGLKYNRHTGDAQLPATDSTKPSERKALLDQVCMKKLTSSFLDTTPPEFREAYNHIRSLPYEQIPDYELLIHLFLKMMKDADEQFDYRYDWLPDKANSRYQLQVDKKRSIICRMIPAKVMPFLALQTHTIQYMEDNEGNTGGGDAVGTGEGKGEQDTMGRRATEDAVFAAFAQRDKAD